MRTGPEAVGNGRTTVSRVDELARRHRDFARAGGRVPGQNLAAGELRLKSLYRRIEKNIEAGSAGSRAEEWLLDNRHVLEQVIASAAHDLPRAFLRRLPRVSCRESGAPVCRVAELARAVVEVAERPVELLRLERLVLRYQKQINLTTGELWALPGLLRLELLFALLDHVEESFGNRARPGAAGLETDEAAAATEVAGYIISLRTLTAHDWRDTFERLSAVERELNRDPAGAYSRMDFESRDRYRRIVEVLARGSGLEEADIARRIVSRARRSDPGDSRTAHVGYYLYGGGRRLIEREIRFRPGLRIGLVRIANAWPDATYFSLLALASTLLLGVAGTWLNAAGQGPAALAATLVVLASPAVGLAVVLVNLAITWLMPPRVLAKLDFSRGIPPEFKTAVVVPVLFASRQDVDQVLECLEINYLSNTDRRLVYIVLSDLADAPEQEMPGDRELADHAGEAIRSLNRRHGRGPQRGPFLLLHRRRLWNPAEGCWMGWERKRGKLTEFNRLLGGAADTSFCTTVGESRRLEGIRYVITLDADTRLPPESARRLVGTMAHPLSLAVIDAPRGVLKSGYSILQPRMEIDPDSAEQTAFARIFSGGWRVDLYNQASSNAYHDLFGEGIYAGKGIYDWRAFEHTLAGRIPENAVLSHDLLEGAHGRTGLVSDIVLIEHFPANSVSFMRRLHRWIRGDWQLLPWLLPRVRDAGGSRRPNPLHAVHRWKILDNLRRSLAAPALLALLAIAWLGLLPGSPLVWTAAAASLLAAPIIGRLVNLIGSCLARPLKAVEHLRHASGEIGSQLRRWLLELLLLPYQSLVSTDAIARALYRLMTRRRLLEWTTAAHVHGHYSRQRTAAARWREMWFSPAWSAITFVATALIAAGNLPVAAPFLAAWLAAPAAIAPLDRPRRRPAPLLDPASRRYLRRLARRTWLFFDRFVGPDNHWLPPDNFQDQPGGHLARRTSPTNLGMALTSALAAWDFGYLDTRSLAAWLGNSMDRMKNLERHRGHWLNWYETRDLHPLEPRYVSTVDSGNLAASLITLAHGLDEIAGSPLSELRAARGVEDTLAVIAENLRGIPGLGSDRLSAEDGIVEKIEAFGEDLERMSDPAAAVALLRRLQEDELPRLVERLVEFAERPDVGLTSESLGDFRAWTDTLHRQISRALDYHDRLLPWIAALDELPPIYRDDSAASDLADSVAEFQRQLARPVSLANAPACYRELSENLETLNELLGRKGLDAAQARTARDWNRALALRLEESGQAVGALLSELGELRDTALRWFQEMDFGFLYDRDRQLFRIGYNVSAAALDPNFYDLLASESRLASLVAIAKGDVPLRHWLHLERPFRRRRRRLVMMSWSATLFEYLMPVLFVRTPPETLLGRACLAAIELHREFGRRLNLPWGISESAYYQFDAHNVYQYRAFGVPGLGFRRDLGNRIVVAPYASVMALPFAPGAVVENLRALERYQGLGQYGFFDAVDFGRAEKRAPRRARVARTWMSHHQGMAMLAIDNFLNDSAMQRRFHADRRIAGVSMLSHERLPKSPPTLPATRARARARPFSLLAGPVTWPVEPGADNPRYTVLSNGHLSVVLNAAGGGGVHWNQVELAPFAPDPTTNEAGNWIYLKDLEANRWFSIGRHPGGHFGGQRSVRFGPHRAEFQQRAADLLCRLTVGVAAQHDIEARKLVIHNQSPRPRRLLVASFAALALAPAAEFRRHPAFARLFVESECLEDESILIFKRRPRNAGERPLYFAHTVLASPEVGYRFGWETDRGRFLGRGRSHRNPAALEAGLEGFSGSTGAVLDPAAASAVELVIEPYGQVEIAWLNTVGHSRRALLQNLRSYRSLGRVNWLFEQAFMQSGQELHNLRIPPAEGESAMDLLSAAVAPPRQRRRFGPGQDQPLQAVLWSRGISGDRPIILVHLCEEFGLAALEKLLQAHSLLCGRQLGIDLVLVDEHSTGYAQQTRDRLHELIERVRARTHRRLFGQVFVVSGRDLSQSDRHALDAAAHLVMEGADLEHRLEIGREAMMRLPRFMPVPAAEWVDLPTPPIERDSGLLFDNGTGGFSPDSREYIVHLEPGRETPAPWIQVLANPGFGCLVTERGTSCTWAENSSELRLTPWPNDPVTDTAGEAVYLRDEETGVVWNPTPGPVPATAACQIRYGPGYVEFRQHSHGLEQRYSIHVDPDSPVKICRLTLTNLRGWTRRLTATAYVEWVLGTTRADEQYHIATDFDPDTEALLAQNIFSRLTGSRTAFLAASLEPHSITADRAEFLGPGGSVERPEALERMGLNGTVIPGDDPCAACQVHVDIAAGATQEFHFVIGQGANREQALDLVRCFRRETAAQASRERAEAFWRQHLDTIQVQTPEPAMDLMLNCWLPYQALACRVWGRSAYYQSSGAFGFRDQLQDVMALVWSRPEAVRDHLLTSAARQFRHGDVLHWWHENPLRGVRTRCSDDLLWLPYVTAHYIRTTGDSGVLDENIAYLEGPQLERDENERYAEFEPGEFTGSLYEHCCRAIDRASNVGPHGLPTIGSGDWNDGMNRVSTTGRGESVWLAWFLARVLQDFAPCCEHRGDQESARRYRELAGEMIERADRAGWDGAWYRRGYFDDGTPLGSAESEECRIDLIAQAWAVLARDKPTERTRQAMASAWERLVRVRERLVLLLDPPFDLSKQDPGYIKGYPPGIRENGAQYTHAATWAVWAQARLGDGDGAMELFRLLNPVLRSSDPESMRRYRVEPYVLAGDIYSIGANAGRGGWSWYTGAAGWLWRAGIEALLGLKLRSGVLEMDPCLPGDWTGYRAELRRGEAVYRIEVTKPRGVQRGRVNITLDGRDLEGSRVPLVDDGRAHSVTVEIKA